MAGEGRPLVMLVDDDEATLYALGRWLDLGGYRTVTASNGAEALQQLRSGLRPAVILLDMRMPEMDGAEFRALQRADAELAEIPVVLVTEQPHPHRHTDPLAVDDYFPKSARPELLLEIVRRYAEPATA
ncbi:MAG: response regulator [Armatimonadota bacterium]